MDKGTILVVEDEPNIADLVDLYLSRDGFRVLKTPTGEGGLAAIRDHRPRLVVLDVGLPDIDGLEVCRRIRATSVLPVIFLTAVRTRSTESSVSNSAPTTTSRNRSPPPNSWLGSRRCCAGPTGRRPWRCSRPAGSRWTSGGGRSAFGDLPVDFTTKEFDLLRFLAERPGLALSRQQILDAVWGHDWFGDERTVDVHIAQVRKKLGTSA